MGEDEEDVQTEEDETKPDSDCVDEELTELNKEEADVKDIIHISTVDEAPDDDDVEVDSGINSDTFVIERPTLFYSTGIDVADEEEDNDTVEEKIPREEPSMNGLPRPSEVTRRSYSLWGTIRSFLCMGKQYVMKRCYT